MDPTEPARFITIAFSHYCDKARWAMDRRGFPYREESHTPGFHRLVTQPLGARGSVPVLCTAGRKLDDSTAIVLHVDEHGGPGERLLPGAQPAREDCLALESYFDEKLGPHSRRLVYYHLLGERNAALRLLGTGGRDWERALLSGLFPLLRVLMRRGMRIDAAGAARSRQALDQVFAAVTQRLADGRRYLVGEHFTVADLTFAALASPVLLPAEYGGGGFALPELSELPPELGRIVEECRASPAGAFALRLYREERAVKGQPSRAR